MKIRSVEELEDFIAKEYAWRRKELTNLGGLVSSSKKHNQDVLMRSSIPILYAHWEGFVKRISQGMLLYLVAKGFKYKELQPSFWAYAAMEKHQGQIPSKNFDAIARLFTENQSDISTAIRVDPARYIDTKSNLNSEVLKDITRKLGLDYSRFELKENWIDETFVGLRNSICHGERAQIDLDSFNDVYAEAIGLIDEFKNLVLNSVYEKSYLNSATQAAAN